MTKRTSDDIYEFMRDRFEEVKSKQDVTNSKLETLEEWRKQHEKSDNEKHTLLHRRISGIRNTAGIFGSAGFVGGVIVSIVTGIEKLFK